MRAGRNRMTRTRRTVQFGFLLIVLVGVFVIGGNCERWCPFGGVEALATYLSEGNMICSLGTANLFVLGGVLGMTVLMRRAFCGYACPIGTISEWTRAAGRRLRLPEIRVPLWLDRRLAWLKYVLLVVILWFTWQAGELIFRGFDPCYALISRHGEDITVWTYAAAATLVAGSLFLILPFCRWLCPLAAVLNPFSRFAVARVRRDTESCGDCGVCGKRCPVAIPVDQVAHVTHARCIACLQCVESCPDRRTRTLTWGPAWGAKGARTGWPQITIVLTVLVCTSAAVAASYLFPLPSFVRTRGTAPAETAEVLLRMSNVACRGNANLLCYFLERDDIFAIPGYLRVEAWPAPVVGQVRVTYDPAQTDQTRIQQAIMEPYFEVLNDHWRMSPFGIEGYDPLAEILAIP